MTFDQALTSLLGLIGGRVDVMVGPADHAGPCPFVTFHGVLHSGTKAPVPEPAGECFYFSLAGVDAAFWLARERFHGARDARGPGPTVDTGDVQITVWRGGV